MNGLCLRMRPNDTDIGFGRRAAESVGGLLEVPQTGGAPHQASMSQRPAGFLWD